MREIAVKYIHRELVAIRQELKTIRRGLEFVVSLNINPQEVVRKSHYSEKISEDIEKVYRQVRFDAPDLAKDIKNYMLDKERKKAICQKEKNKSPQRIKLIRFLQ